MRGIVESVAKRSKKHHYVPRLVLRGFAKADTIGCYDLIQRRAYKLSINDAAAQNDYNTIETADGARSDAAEQVMATVEAAAAPALAAVGQPGWEPTAAEKASIARFLALQFLRVPRQREFSDAIADSVMKLQMAASGPRCIEKVLAKDGREASREEVLERWKAIEDFNWQVRQDTGQHVVRSLEMVDELAPMLFGMYSWCVVRWERRRILMGDNPLLLLRASDSPAWSGVGLATAGRILFGVNRACALVLVSKMDGEMADGTALLPTVALARGMSRHCAHAATARIFHHPDDDLDDILGSGFTLPIPDSVDLESEHTLRLRAALAGMAKHAYDHPDEPHPMSRLPGSTFHNHD